MTLKYGEVSWEDTALPGEQGENRQSDFITLAEGDNKGRVLSNPQQFYVHWVSDETGKTRKVNCSTDGCPVCMRGQDGDKASPRWLVKFLTRKEGRVGLLEISTQVFKGVKTLVQDPEWGVVTEYDINVKRGPKGAQPLYTVIPGRRTPLTTEEKEAFKNFNERVDVKRFITPPAPEVVAEKLGWTLERTQKTAVSSDFRSSNAAKPAPAKKPAIDFDFDAQ